MLFGVERERKRKPLCISCLLHFQGLRRNFQVELRSLSLQRLVLLVERLLLLLASAQKRLVQKLELPEFASQSEAARTRKSVSAASHCISGRLSLSLPCVSLTPGVGVAAERLLTDWLLLGCALPRPVAAAPSPLPTPAGPRVVGRVVCAAAPLPPRLSPLEAPRRTSAADKSTRGACRLCRTETRCCRGRRRRQRGLVEGPCRWTLPPRDGPAPSLPSPF